MCNFAENKIRNYVPCPMYVYVYTMQYISFALCPIPNCPPCYILPMPYSRFPRIYSLCSIPYSIVPIPYSSYLIPYTCPIHDSCIPYSMHVPYSILPILLFLIPYYLFHMNSYDPFVASLSGPKQRCAVWVAHRLDQTWGGRGHA